MTARQLEVWVNSDLVGFLREENDLWQFEYSQEWQSSIFGYDLSPALPRATLLHADGASNRPVQWYFDNLLPEEELRSVLAKDARINAEDAFALLAYYGAESAGSLILRDPASPVSVDHGVVPLPLEELNRRILNLPNVPLTNEAPKRMSLAGAQHKMLAVFQDGKLYEPMPATPSTHILKPNHQGGAYPASAVNEYFAMRLAKEVGLDVPNVHLLYAPQPAYLIDRFDRSYPEGQGKQDVLAADAKRRHVIDTCQLLNKSRGFKYKSADIATLTEAIEHCRGKAATRLKLYRWLVFNIIIGNSDNHLKNISFTVEARGINLAPAYDILCTAAYETRAIAADNARWPKTELAFSIGDAKTFADVTREHLLNAGEALKLSRATAVRELDRMLAVIPPAVEKLMQEIASLQERLAEACPDPAAARRNFAGERRVLRIAQTIIIKDMCSALTPNR